MLVMSFSSDQSCSVESNGYAIEVPVPPETPAREPWWRTAAHGTTTRSKAKGGGKPPELGSRAWSHDWPFNH
ncbi:hypothetical protein CGRA01v4_11269 [Colletotrichum graminicola]|nr:hypothetical protein CGRA01v4_11269 [Colletotrichum graminicola]